MQAFLFMALDVALDVVIGGRMFYQFIIYYFIFYLETLF